MSTLIRIDMEMQFRWTRGVALGIGRYAREAAPEWRLVLQSSFSETSLGRPAGVVGLFAHEKERLELERLQRDRTALVCVSGFNPPPGVSLVTHDNDAIGRLAAEHLMEQGVRRTCCLRYGGGRHFRERAEAFARTLGEAGCPAPSQVEEWSRSEILQHAQSGRGPMGVFAVSDSTAAGLVKLAMEVGCRIPDDLLVLGVDNDEIQCEMCPVSLSSIELRFEEIGWRAAEQLHRQLRGEAESPVTVRVPPSHVVARRSTHYLAVEDVRVRRVLQILREEFARPLRTDELARRAGISRRDLEIRFRRSLGTSIHGELKRIRLREGARLLLETVLPVGEVAASVGIEDAGRFAQYFREIHGVTPREYRGQNFTGGSDPGGRKTPGRMKAERDLIETGDGFRGAI